MGYNKVIIYRSMHYDSHGKEAYNYYASPELAKSEGDSFKLQPIVLRVPAGQDSITLMAETKGN